MSIGGDMLLEEHGDDINVAIAWLKGELGCFKDRVHDVVNQTTVAAAKVRLELIAAGVIDEPT
jgi:hypothetical protein